MIKEIVIGKMQGEDFFVDCEVGIDNFITANQEDMPTALAEAINYAIAFEDSVCRDFNITDITVGLVPETDEFGNLTVSRVLLDMRGEHDLEPYDSMLLTAYLAVSGIQSPVALIGDMAPRVVVSPLASPGGSYEVTITVNNDTTGDIYDVTQSRLVVRLVTDKPRWDLELKGSYDIDRDRFFTVNGEEELRIERANQGDSASE